MHIHKLRSITNIGITGKAIATVLTAKEEESMEPDLIYTEEVLVKPTYAEIEGLPSKLKITNRYGYSEHDTIVLKDYRISCSKIE